MTCRTVLFVAGDRLCSVPSHTKSRETLLLAPERALPRCLVQLRADGLWDGKGEIYSNFELEFVRLAGRSAARTRKRVEDYASRFNAYTRPLFVTVCGRHSLIPALRRAAVLCDVPFPAMTMRVALPGIFSVKVEAAHFDLAEYLELGRRPPGAVLGDLLAGCGIPADLVRSIGTATLTGALLRALATCLLYLRTVSVMGCISPEARWRAENDVLDRLLRHVPNHAAAVALHASIELRSRTGGYPAA